MINKYIWHKVLKRPLELRVVSDYQPKNPDMTVLFLHGIAANGGTWRETINFLKKQPETKNLRMVNLDLLGFGGALTADWLKYDYKEYSQALRQTIKHLHIKTPLVIAGHSMGCLIAAKFALDYQPSLNLILVSPPVLKPKELKSLPDNFYLKTYDKISRDIDKPPLSTLAPFVEAVSSFRSKYTKTTAFYQSMQNVILNAENFKTFKRLTYPTWIINGRFDPLVLKANLQELAEKNHHIQLINVMARHDINYVKQVRIAEILTGIKQHENL